MHYYFGCLRTRHRLRIERSWGALTCDIVYELSDVWRLRSKYDNDSGSWDDKPRTCLTCDCWHSTRKSWRLHLCWVYWRRCDSEYTSRVDRWRWFLPDWDTDHRIHGWWWWNRAELSNQNRSNWRQVGGGGMRGWLWQWWKRRWYWD